jgi:TRAP-type C4-dicarboxylate transport system substrate-binding protein
MNKKKWNALPADAKKIIEKVNVEWIEKQWKSWDEIDKEGYEFIKEKGNKVISLSAAEDARWAKAVQPVLDNYVADTKKRGLPGDKVLTWIKDYLKKNDKKPF